MSDAREQADQAADRVRDELLTTLVELDRRRTQVTDWRYQLDAHRRTLTIVGACVAGLVVGGVGIAVARRQVTRRRVVRRRWDALGRAWKHPERVATRADDAPGWQQLLRKAILAFGVALATRAGKRAATSMVPTSPKRPPGEPYLH
jgi:hypothetical protein